MVDAKEVPVRNPKWEFTLLVDGRYTVNGNDGTFVVYKIVLTDTGKQCFITAFGKKVSGAPQGRSVRFSVGGTRYPPPPRWILDLVAIHGFPRTEIEV